jgi:hypothetical protein
LKNAFILLFFIPASFLFLSAQAYYYFYFENGSAVDIIFKVVYNNHPSVYGPRVIYPGDRVSFSSGVEGYITKEFFLAAIEYAIVYDDEGNVIVTFDDLLDDTYFNDSIDHAGHLIFKIDDAAIERGRLKYGNLPKFNEQITNKPLEFYNIKVESKTELMYRINYKQPLSDGAGGGYRIADKTFAHFFPIDNILRILYFDRNDEAGRGERFRSAFTEISVCDTEGYVIMTMDDIDESDIVIGNTYKTSIYSNMEYIITIREEDVDKGRIKYRDHRRITQRGRRR